ncbi:hypothetical protein NEMBOFW57_002759 [Staphylotrichum longicolle]|uniref:Uncharacterized protein n=1 Tax=Staphylotrichum longicolle TaxID=669026 RepID=A0AAD4F4E0_9PEZI|nr:hypothetical protein NEMBOFW57_002759 [Staphylotrichum longicolle]
MPGHAHESTRPPGSPRSAHPHPNLPSFWTAGAREQPHPNSPASTDSDSDSDADDTPSVPAAYTRPAHVLRPGSRYPYIPHLYNSNARTWIPVNPSAEQWGPPGYSTPSPTESDVDDTAAISDDDTDEDTRFLRQGQGGGARSRRYEGARGALGIARGQFGDGQDPASMEEGRTETVQSRNSGSSEETLVEREPVDGREGDEGHPVSANGTAY